MEKLFKRPSHTKTEGREGKEEESRLFRYSQCPERCHLENTFSRRPISKVENGLLTRNLRVSLDPTS